MVNDPGGERGYYAGKTKQQANLEREKLFDIIRDLVKWENTNDEQVLSRARAEIIKSWRETCELNKGKIGFDPDILPDFHDPFAGGGAIPLEAQRLGLKSYGSDLNPVAVLINKSMIEFPPLFAGRKPVGPVAGSERQGNLSEDWSGAKGLAEDVRRYGTWMRYEAFKRIGHLYPQVELPKEYGGGTSPAIAWLWARTVKSPNPAFSHVDVPLASSFILSSNAGNEAYVDPIVDGDVFRFTVKTGTPPAGAGSGTKAAGRSGNFLCLLSNTPISGEYIRSEGRAGRMGARLMAVVAEGRRGRIYLSPTEEMENIVRHIVPAWKPDMPFFQQALGFRIGNYGLTTWSDLFTNRQLMALNTFSDLVQEIRIKVKEDALAASWSDDGRGLAVGGNGASAYSDAIAVFLAFAIDRCADFSNVCTRWIPSNQKIMNLLGKNQIPMSWDYPEAAILENTVGGLLPAVKYVADCINMLPKGGAIISGVASQADASKNTISEGKVIATDPPYYDNIGYADLSDFFYVWLRKSLRPIYPELFSTMMVPKSEELVATPHRHGGGDAAERFFLDGMTDAMKRLAEHAHSAFPTAIYYAFKQSDTTHSGTGNTGWETFLDAVIKAGFIITGTWPMRTEGSGRLRGIGSNALASSIVLVCRKRASDTETISRKDFLRELRDVLPGALEDMLNGGEGRAPIAPVDLSQAVIGPGMAVFSKYKSVLEADGTPMSVHTAMTLINKFLDEGEDFDPDTRFCLGWFQQYGWVAGEFGAADVLARSKGTHVDHVRDAGVVESGGGKVRLLKVVEYPEDWNPDTDTNMPVWESLHHIIKALSERGEDASGALLAKMPDKAEAIRQLSYRLYTLCERKGWADDARQYNTIITSWSSVEEASHRVGRVGTQASLDL